MIHYINEYLQFLLTWVPIINSLSDLPEDGCVDQNKLEDNNIQLQLTTSLYFVCHIVAHCWFVSSWKCNIIKLHLINACDSMQQIWS
jgi:hypothetical protein